MNKFRIFFSCLLAILLFFPACDSDPKDSETTQKTEWKNNDNTVRYRLPSGPRNLNPVAPRSGYDLMILHYMFQYPLDFSEETLKMEPQLVKTYPTMEEGEDGPSFTYEILEEAVWDNGTPVTGHDYAFTLKALFNPHVPSGGIRDYLIHIKDVLVDEANPKKFTVTTRRKYILAEPTISNVYVMPAHHYDPNGLMSKYALADLTDLESGAKLAETEADLKTFAEQLTSPALSRENIQGSGPYKFVEWVDKQKVVVAKKENWWGDALADGNSLLEAYPDTIQFLFIRDDNTLAAALKDESIDATASVNTKIFKDLIADDFIKERYNSYTPETFNFSYAGFNSKRPKMADPRVRRAIAHLTNLDEVIESYYEGYGVRVAIPFPKEAPYYNNDLSIIKYDVEKAKNLLAEAGWVDSDGDGILDKEIDGEKTQLSIKLMHGGTKFSTDYGQYFADKAKEAGVEILPEEVNFREMVGTKLPARDFDMFSATGSADPLAAMDPYQLWHTDNDKPDGYNRSGFGTPESDKLIEEIRVTLNDDKRHEMMRELQKMIYDFQPWIIYFAPKERVLIHKRFEGKATKLKPGLFVNRLKLKK